MPDLPEALEKDTIIECVFEARFSQGRVSGAELLPGLIYGTLKDFFQTTVTLPLGSLPQIVRDQNPQLQYVPSHALQGKEMRMMFGPRVTAVSFGAPYLGWAKVQPRIIQCMKAVFETSLMGKPERFALKYVNILQQGADEYDLSQTTAKVSLADFQLRREGLAVKAEVVRNDCTSIIEIATGAMVSGPGIVPQHGVLLSVDSSKEVKEENYLVRLPQTLEILHTTEKEVFFGLLSSTTLDKLKPRYAAKHQGKVNPA